jgi:hypothetical protein
VLTYDTDVLQFRPVLESEILDTLLVNHYTTMNSSTWGSHVIRLA